MIKTATPVVSVQFGSQNPVADTIGAMSPSAGVQGHSGAPASQVRAAQVDPLTKSNMSSRGKAMAWKNPVAGQGTFMNFDEGAPTNLPSPDFGAR